MPALTTKRFTHPETLRQIRPAALRAWLATARPFFESHGLQVGRAVPAGRSSDRAPLDYDHLARLLLQPAPDMPPELIDSLYLIHEMATPAGLDAILEAAPAHRLQLDLGSRPTPADVALQAWLADRRLLETLHHRQELRRPRSFQYFSTAVEPLPPFPPPVPAQLAALETRLDAFYQAWQRGRGARVFAYWQADECWFLVLHGLPWRREDTLDDGEPGAVHFRPQAHDVLVYDPARGELRVNCCSRREREVLLASFGLELFGRKDFFPGVAKYTLAPLVRQGRDCLACLDVRGLLSVSLKEVEFFYPQAPWQRVTRKSNDIFALIERGALRWPDDVRQITRATFEIRFRDAPRTRRVTLIPSNKALYARDDDAPVVEHWLAARHFIL
jgi:hypothetical protein